MASFIIHTHGRLQEWVAEENGYFAAEGLTDYVLSSHQLLSSVALPASSQSATADNRQGAYQSYEQGRDASVSCAVLGISVHRGIAAVRRSHYHMGHGSITNHQ